MPGGVDSARCFPQGYAARSFKSLKGQNEHILEFATRRRV